MLHEDGLLPDNYLVDVAHPGSVNTTFAMVEELSRLDCLGRFDTGFYYKQHQWKQLLGFFPNGVRRALQRELNRRQSPNIPQHQVFQTPGLEVLCVLASRMGVSKGLQRALRDHRNVQFDHQTAKRVAEQRTPNLLVVQDGSALQSLEAARKRGVPTVLNQVIGHFSHGREILLEEEARFPKLKGKLVQPRSKTFLASVAQEPAAADWIFAPSDYVIDTVVAQGAKPERVLKLPYSVDTSRFQMDQRKAEDKGPCRLLFVGQISQRKGVLYLLQAIKQLKDPNLELTMVGSVDGGSGEKADWLAGYEDCFRHLVNVPYGEVHALYKQADIFLYPSLHEGSPMAILEAMASGLPVLTTPNSGSVVRDGKDGFLLPIRDVDGLKEKILLLKDNPEMRREMGKSARLESENYGPRQYAGKLLNCLKIIQRGS